MRDKVIKIKLMNKNKRHIGLKMSSIKTRTAHSPTVRLSKNPLTFKQQKVDNIWLKMYLID